MEISVDLFDCGEDLFGSALHAGLSQRGCGLFGGLDSLAFEPLCHLFPDGFYVRFCEGSVDEFEEL